MELHRHTGTDQPKISLRDCDGKIPGSWVEASNTLQASSDAEKATTSTTLVKMKEIRIFRTGPMRIKVEAKVDGGTTNAMRFYLNGVTIQNQTVTSTSYMTYTVTSQDVVSGDYLQIYGGVQTSFTLTIKNFRIYYTLNRSDVDYEIILD